MERLIYKELCDWKDSPNRKPLIINGTRQIGKSYIITEQFGKNEFKQIITIIFTNSKEDMYCKIFKDYTNPSNIIKSIENELNRKISDQNTLIFLDEIQFCPDAISSLKFFYEKLPQFFIVCAGSLLGLTQSFWPVGKVDIIKMFP